MVSHYLLYISPASTHDINLVTEVVDNAVIKRPKSKSISSSKPRSERRRIRRQHLCLDKAYISEQEEQELIKRGYVLHIPIKKEKKRKEERKMMNKNQKRSQIVKNILQRDGLYMERTNSWHNRFRKLFTRYEKKSENYLGLVQFSCCIIIYRKIILG